LSLESEEAASSELSTGKNRMEVREAIRNAEAVLPGEPTPDRQLDPRWQAISRVSDSIESDLNPIWVFVARWGCHHQEDLRDAIATVLLEHLLECHFDLIFPHVCELAATDVFFADTFCRCWKFGQSEQPENARRFDELKATCRLQRRF
jgi:hypothetical protein